MLVLHSLIVHFHAIPANLICPYDYLFLAFTIGFKYWKVLYCLLKSFMCSTSFVNLMIGCHLGHLTSGISRLLCYFFCIQMTSSPFNIKHTKQSSVPMLNYKSMDTGQSEIRPVARSKSDAATRKVKTTSTFYVGFQGTNDSEVVNHLVDIYSLYLIYQINSFWVNVNKHLFGLNNICRYYVYIIILKPKAIECICMYLRA